MPYRSYGVKGFVLSIVHAIYHFIFLVLLKKGIVRVLLHDPFTPNTTEVMDNFKKPVRL